MRLILYADGAARGNPGPAGAGAVLYDEKGKLVAELARPLGHATNNVAEYSALILGLEEAKRRGAVAIDVRMDSLLVVQQMRGLWRIKHPGLVPLALRAGALLASFQAREIRHIPREENIAADETRSRCSSCRSWHARRIAYHACSHAAFLRRPCRPGRGS
ncbi:MAG: ribonuclease HI family protein [Chloroflexi bacterium]|nr:MAG: ribonuclease HI family protein [Chloroflexota bacterium]